jgi:hypothetical protein
MNEMPEFNEWGIIFKVPRNGIGLQSMLYTCLINKTSNVPSDPLLVGIYFFLVKF